MTRTARWVLGLLLPFLLSACGTPGGSTADTKPGDAGAVPVIQLDKPVHFTAPDGTAVLAAPDDYQVEQTTDAQLRLVPNKGGLPLVVAADSVTHDIDLSTPIPLLLAFNEDARNLVLLLPDGTALDAAGSLSGVQPREIIPQRRHYRLTYQLDPTTGQVRFGEGATGQRPPVGKASMSDLSRIGAGALGNLGAGDQLSNFEIQSLLSNYNQAETLSSNIQKKLDDGFPLEENRDRPGGDYAQQTQPNAASCRIACSGDGTCQAFTFVKPPAGASTGQCFLKRTVPAAAANSCCISGVKRSLQQKIR